MKYSVHPQHPIAFQRHANKFKFITTSKESSTWIHTPLHESVCWFWNRYFSRDSWHMNSEWAITQWSSLCIRDTPQQSKDMQTSSSLWQRNKEISKWNQRGLITQWSTPCIHDTPQHSKGMRQVQVRYKEQENGFIHLCYPASPYMELFAGFKDCWSSRDSWILNPERAHNPIKHSVHPRTPTAF